MTEKDWPLPGVSRRDFLKYCSWVAAALSVPTISALDVADALAQAVATRPSVVYSSFQACTGCAISILQNREPSVANLILKQISLDYQDNVMAAAGTAAEELFQKVTSGEFYWVAEGSIPTKIPEALLIGGRTGADIAAETYPKAKAVIAHGSCACFGNIQASDPDPTGAMGIADYLKQRGVSGPPIINMPRCPGNGDDLVAALSYVLVTGEAPPLDVQGRPKFLYGSTIHDGCYRRGHFDAGQFVKSFNDPKWNEGWCLYEVGCKGPFTYAPCGVTKWNGNVSWCVHNGPCMGCSERGFWDKQTPFFEQTRGANFGMGGANGPNAEGIGLGLGALTVVGLGAHAIGQVATGRMGRGGPPEEKKGVTHNG